MWYVYVLESITTKQLYKGLTDNLPRRLNQHFLGKSMTTRKLLPLRLVHVEICKNRSEARTIEKYLKSGYGREILREIVSNNVEVAELVDAQS